MFLEGQPELLPQAPASAKHSTEAGWVGVGTKLGQPLSSALGRYLLCVVGKAK